MTKRLTKDQFLATMSEPMADVTGKATDVLDIWPYVDSVPRQHWEGHMRHDDLVECVYRSPDEKYDHVMVMTRTENVYLVVIVDLVEDRIYGHHLLDLNHEYGVDNPEG